MKFPKLVLISLTLAATVSGADYPRRIISLAPSITRNLFLLGAGERIVGVTVYCREYAQNKEEIGTLLEPNIEKIVSLQPDLIVASKEGNNRDSVNKLAHLGLKVHVLAENDSFADICAGFLELGRIIGSGQQAAEIILAARKRINAVKSRVLRLAKPSVFWELGTKPVFTACRASFINDFMEISGGRNIFLDLDARYSQVSREEVVRRNPDIIIIAAPNEALPAEKERWEKFPAMSAVKNKKIFILEDRLYTEPSPLAFAQAVENIAKIIHPRGEKQ